MLKSFYIYIYIINVKLTTVLIKNNINKSVVVLRNLRLNCFSKIIIIIITLRKI